MSGASGGQALASRPAATGRLHGLDRLRTWLTVLVVVHHTAITYGGSGSWFYREVADGGTPTGLLLSMLCAIDQAFFMGAFFLLAGYVAPPALTAKGWPRLLRERLLRLGLPLLVFAFVLGPLTLALARTQQGQPLLATWWALVQRGLPVLGPLWFNWALLLMLPLVALGLRWWPPLPAGAPLPPVPGHRAWLLAALGVGTAALLIRQWVPVGRNLLGLQLGYFASYLFLFMLGLAAWRGRWLERLPPGQVRVWKRVSLWAVPLLPLTAAATGALSGRSVDFNGGLGLAAVVYAFWEPFVAWGLIAALLQRALRAPPPGAWGRRIDGAAYGAFVLHAPVLVAISVALAGWAAPAALKFAVVATLASLLSFGLAMACKRLPGLRRVL